MSGREALAWIGIPTARQCERRLRAESQTNLIRRAALRELQWTDRHLAPNLRTLSTDARAPVAIRAMHS